MVLDEPKEADEVFDDRGLKYIIEKNLYDQVKPLKVDYVSTPMGSGFSISSSMQAQSGCGSSCSC
jgi:iron-sulfur cluster assembly protein